MVAELSGAAASEDGAAMPGRARQRRLWSCAEKRALVGLASAAGSSVTEVAQAFGVAPSQLYAWRKQMTGDLDVDQAVATFAARRRERSGRGRTPRRRLPGPGRQDRRGLCERRAIADRWDRRSDSAAHRPGGVEQVITVVPTDRIYLCCGATDMRRGINSLARMVQQVLALNPHTGAIFCFRGRKGHIIKILAHDDQGFCLLTKRLTVGRPPRVRSPFRSPRHSFRCFWKGSTGAERARLIGRVWPATFARLLLILSRFCFREGGLSGM
ncbi:IS66 family insertion sequence element accessory protein TnpB [Mesorhizobium sp. WSM3882]|uniref:IS66 family insertion sequence element accessory protein TnpB n=1 Tax=Mesorhizobium sp. WSM3882 TaxID=2029407 RepID=UPI0032AF5372